MKESKQTNEILYLNVTKNLSVDVIQHKEHEFLIPCKDVAFGYGVSEANIRKHKRDHKTELAENVHFVKGVTFSNTLEKNYQPNRIYWTKAGVIRLGFFIKSERAKLFRDWAEHLILKIDERIIDIMTDVCEIEDKNLRIRIASKLTKGGRYE